MVLSKIIDILLVDIYVVIGDAANIVLDPIFIFVFRMDVSGAAIAHVISQ
jgi:Na+-driven multidrug efflux pump